MKKVKINLENCYGINSLKEELDFSQKKSHVIYAPNGVMKTSFAKTFQDLSKGEESSDRVYKDRKTKRIIHDENNSEISKEQVFVMEPYNQDYESSKISTLLVNKVLKSQYESIYKKIDDQKEVLIRA